MRRLRALLLAPALLLSAPGAADDSGGFDEADRAAFADIVDWANAQPLRDAPYAELVQALATQPHLLGRPYVAAPLDRNAEPEHLDTAFAGFDCVTYVETVLALAETLVEQRANPQRYGENLAALRYREARPAYCERLHYFSDWARRNVEQNRLADVTREVAGAVPLAFRTLPQGLDYLSRHARANPVLAGHEDRLACVRERERALSLVLARDGRGQAAIEYLPTARLAEVLPRLHGGDVIAWVSRTPGLDVMHVGIALQRKGDFALAHASQRERRVVIAPSLLDYARQLRPLGVLILRPLAPAAP